MRSVVSRPKVMVLFKRSRGQIQVDKRERVRILTSNRIYPRITLGVAALGDMMFKCVTVGK